LRGWAKIANYKTADWVKQVREATEGLGPDLIVDGTGGETFDKALGVAALSLC
jgi:NADPH:quinone reductase-like Zn-dependent oxidoreductase